MNTINVNIAPSSNGNIHVTQELRDRWPSYEFLGKPFKLGNGKTYIRALHKTLQNTHYYEFESDWFWWDRPPTQSSSSSH